MYICTVDQKTHYFGSNNLACTFKTLYCFVLIPENSSDTVCILCTVCVSLALLIIIMKLYDLRLYKTSWQTLVEFNLIEQYSLASCERMKNTYAIADKIHQYYRVDCCVSLNGHASCFQ